MKKWEIIELNQRLMIFPVLLQTSGKLEKAEILEMTVEYLRAIQATETGIRLQNGILYSINIQDKYTNNIWIKKIIKNHPI